MPKLWSILDGNLFISCNFVNLQRSRILLKLKHLPNNNSVKEMLSYSLGTSTVLIYWIIFSVSKIYTISQVLCRSAIVVPLYPIIGQLQMQIPRWYHGETIWRLCEMYIEECSKPSRCTSSNTWQSFRYEYTKFSICCKARFFNIGLHWRITTYGVEQILQKNKILCQVVHFHAIHDEPPFQGKNHGVCLHEDGKVVLKCCNPLLTTSMHANFK